jgi:acyl-coenzyme A synthetase/AMP-(fatty) acid ligase
MILNNKSTHPLRIKIRKILNGTSSFKMSYYKQHILTHTKIKSIKEQLLSSIKNNSPGIFFYRLLNTNESIIHLLTFIHEGYKPIIIPNQWSENQIKKISIDYPNIPIFDEFQFKYLEQPCEPLYNTDPNFIFALCTSGSTGIPKIVCASDSGITSSVEAINKSQCLDSVENTLVFLPLYYSYALINQLFWCIHYEKWLIITNGLQNLAGFLDLLKNVDIQMICMVGQQIKLLEKLQICTPKYSTHSVKVINFAGAPFPYQHLPSIKKLFPEAIILNNYGCTEALPRLTVGSVNQMEPTSKTGPAIPSITLKIESSNNEKIGKICFKGPSVSIGLLDTDGKIQPHSSSEWIYSGDSGYIDDKKNLHVLGRYDDIVNVGGERISLQTITNFLKDNKCIEEVHTFNLKTKENETKIIAVVKLKEKTEDPNFRRFLSSNVNKLYWPKNIYEIDEYPMTANQKIDLNKIKKLVENQTLKSLFKYIGL